MNRRIVFPIFWVMLFSMLVSTAFATEEIASNVTAYRTTIKTRTDQLNLSTTPVAGFTATTMTCPATATNGCTLRVHFDVQAAVVFLGVGADAVAANVSITGSGDAVDPQSQVTINDDPASVNGGFLTNSFAWMKRGITAGSNETVNVNFNNQGGASFISLRTLTIELYTN